MRVEWAGAVKALNLKLILLRNSTIRSDEGLTLEIPASKSLYGGQCNSDHRPTELRKPNYLVILNTDAAPQFLLKRRPFIHDENSQRAILPLLLSSFFFQFTILFCLFCVSNKHIIAKYRDTSVFTDTGYLP